MIRITNYGQYIDLFLKYEDVRNIEILHEENKIGLEKHCFNHKDPRISESLLATLVLEKITPNKVNINPLELLTKALKRKDSYAMTTIGVMLLERTNGKRTDGLELLKDAARLKNTLAINYLAKFYTIGLGVEKDLSKAFAFYYNGAKLKDRNSLYMAATCLKEGTGVPRNYELANKLYYMAADLGHHEAIKYVVRLIEKDHLLASKYFNYLYSSRLTSDIEISERLAKCYYDGYGVEENLSKAMFNFKKAYDGGAKHVAINIANIYYDQKKYKEALNYYLESFNQVLNPLVAYKIAIIIITLNHKESIPPIENPVRYMKYAADNHVKEAYYQMAKLMFNNKFVKQDLDKYIDYLILAKDNGEALAIYDLGVSYFKGLGRLTKDYSKAFLNFKLAEENDIKQSYYYLAKCYLGGLGTKKDLSLGKEYLKKAIKEEKNSEAMRDLALLYMYTKDEEIRAKGFKLMYRASINNLVDATYYVGLAYYKGIGTRKNLDRAFYYFKKAAEKHYPKALRIVSDLYSNGTYLKEDKEKAFSLIKEAADQEYMPAIMKIIDLYLKGEGVKASPSLAKVYVDKAIALGSTLALCYLANSYFTGLFTKVDKEEGFKTYLKAATLNEKSAYHNLAICYKEGLGTSKDLNKALFYLNKSYDELKHQKDLDLINEINLELNKIKAKDILHIVSRKDTFISWNHLDKDLKDQIADELNRNDILSVWESDGDGVGELNEIIKDAIKEAKSFIIIISGNSIESSWVKKEVELIFKEVEETKELLNTIVPIIVNSKVIDNEETYFDTVKMINSSSKYDVFKKCLSLSTQFETKDKGVDLKALVKAISLAKDTALLIDYRFKMKNRYLTFNAALTDDISDGKLEDNPITSTLTFNKGYLNRPVYDEKNNVVFGTAILDHQYSLIYGDGGSGKTLYLKNIVRESFDSNRYIFYLASKDINENIYNVKKFSEYLRKEVFNKVFDSKYNIEEAHFLNIFMKTNDVIILIDALDETNNSIKDKLYNLLKEFIECYPNVKFIFTSRNKKDATTISKYLEKDIEVFKLKGLEEKEIEKLFDNIKASAYKMLDKKDLDTTFEEDVDINSSISKEYFFSSLKSISPDIKKNPLLLSNLIYVYIAKRKMPNKQFEIIAKSNELLTASINSEQDISEHDYTYYLKDNRLNDLLGYLSIKRAGNDERKSHEIFKSYLEGSKLLRKNDNIDEVSKYLVTYLSSRSIIVNDQVSHEIFSNYYSALYIFNHYFVKDENIDTCITSYSFKDKSKKTFTSYLASYLSKEDGAWPNISTYLVSKLDYEIYMLDVKAKMDKYHCCYNLFDDVLTLCCKSEYHLPKKALDELKSLTKHNSLYFNDFIISYLPH